MAQRPTYEDLMKRITGLEKEVSELKAISESLRESEQRYRDILNRMEEEYYEVDLAGNFTFANEVTFRNHGYPPDELMGMNYHAYMSPETAQEIYMTFKEVYRTGIPAKTVDYEVIRKDGTRTMNEMSVSLMRDATGAPIGFSGISRDRTELIQTEKALRESEESYRSILALAPDAIVIASAKDGRYVQINNAFCQITGYSPEEAIGRTGLDLNLYPDPAERGRLLDALQRDGRLDGLEIRFQAKDGAIMHHLVSARPIRFKGEQCVLVMATVITPIKEAERALRENEEKYRSILDSMEEGYYEVDLKGDTTFFNESLCRMHGYARDEMMHTPYRKYTHLQEAERIYRIFNEVYKTGVPAKAVDYQVIRKDGLRSQSRRLSPCVETLLANPSASVGSHEIERNSEKRKRL